MTCTTSFLIIDLYFGKEKVPFLQNFAKHFCGAQERTLGIRVEFGKALIFEVTRRSLKIQMSEIDNFPHI